MITLGNVLVAFGLGFVLGLAPYIVCFGGYQALCVAAHLTLALRARLRRGGAR
jgi:hypothetical protein